ncbi:drug/metabolite transporter (DMT)-like permease [Comamonas odontotermitis]|uniref:Drug/metabolite transporter (DMT)-like permease n=1 Tax=Comamonas odontotermitis TaxID=379895 RepID=A0ABR6RJ17_9BURK|nr:DMT family transporter [Comamonas odontotermitis]MBB6579170.1 drug/metabolite transporter (DMT)-like permease [Comamonas odontotermitis]
MNALTNRGVLAALGAAVLFGAGTPAVKLLLEHASPWLLAGILYLGSGIGLLAYRLVTRAPSVALRRSELGWLAGAVISGGMVGPLLLMTGLSGMTASDASLLLNAEGVLTAVLAWFVFKENFDRRIALGMVAIVAGAIVLSWPSSTGTTSLWPSLAIIGACLCWAIDNNLTRKVSVADASFVAMVKGLAAGATNLVLALATGIEWPSPAVISIGAVIGFLSYGSSLVLFVVALRNLGTARTGAYFSVAPFFGALLAILFLGEATSLRLLVAGLLMAIGVWLHLTEAHGHEHTHEVLEHSHEHEHDAHHQHVHADGVNPMGKHVHWHRHEPLTHSHEHFPDVHHQHQH